MFLNYIKDFFLKRIYKRKIQEVKNITSNFSIETVGLLIDESYFFNKQDLVKELISHGILEKNIKVIVYKNKIKRKENYSIPTFNIKDFNWKIQISNSEVNDFIKKDFDLLISYYDVEKAALLKITQHSKAKFKVGFSTIDKRLNNLTINTNAENYLVFVEELFKYLKILNKI